jgi:ABC-type polysaccharide/polyol phosphate export permease
MNIEKTIKNTLIAVSMLSFAVLATMKFTGVIDWSWLWVTLPLWWPLVLFAAVAVGVYLAMIFAVAGSVFK